MRQSRVSRLAGLAWLKRAPSHETEKGQEQRVTEMNGSEYLLKAPSPFPLFHCSLLETPSQGSGGIRPTWFGAKQNASVIALAISEIVWSGGVVGLGHWTALGLIPYPCNTPSPIPNSSVKYCCGKLFIIVNHWFLKGLLKYCSRC